MADEKQYDLIILGSGSTAVAAAHKARNHKKSVVMIEESLIGGTCLNVGCVPSKYLIEAARRYHLSCNPRHMGLGKSQPKLDFASLISEKDEIVEQYRKEKTESFKPGVIDVIHGHASFIDNRTIKVGEKTLTGINILIATGSKPSIPSIVGLPAVDYITSDLLTTEGGNRLADLPSTLAIIGGGYIAVELGQMFSRFGTKVVIFEGSERILKSGFDHEVGDLLAKTFASEGIEILFNTKVDEVNQSENGVKVSFSGENSGARMFQKILIATGRSANTSSLDIQNSGVLIDQSGNVVVDKHLVTNVENIYAAGDVIGAQHGNEMATPVGVQDGFMAVHNMLADPFNKLSVSHRVIPRAVFTDPEVACVGVTAEGAAKVNIEVISATIPMKYTPRAVIAKEESGFAKIVADKRTREVLGVTVVGHAASEFINMAAMAMRFHAKLEDFVETIYVYPTMSECLRFVAHKAQKEFK